ncbi:condensin complex subunit 2 isoform X2 [Phalaenopsis equestris]|uniref:condensin complex subunit 2 isoform X2 n=1 Tax=Phalaenopsis equestris TaxID=78828 RepID=UPI0009E34D1F|nr:condensin complex subunit 2 isoform X2 [Phalaenopsis equestris]
MSSAEDEKAMPTISTAAMVKQKGCIPMAPRLLSPTHNSFPLGSNDDELERAQARAARIASIRRKPAANIDPACSPSRPNLLNHEQIMDLLNNCLKLASENKINQKNTWELNLIDHLSEIIQNKPEVDDAETNFQKASCTLEAGVKIYSLRVDSLHSEAYKVLGGINRVGREDGNENLAERNHVHDRTEQEEGVSRKEVQRKLSPLSTLETSFEALNIKKFDVAFTVDPLYHQTSAQFDEGGAKGLLLNNLGIYGSCRVLFDSLEVPEKCILNDTESDQSGVIDLSFAKDYLDLMVINMPKKADISPTLRDIMDLVGENNHKLRNEFSVEKHSTGHGETDDIDHPNLEDNFFPDVSDHEGDISTVVDDNSRIVDPDFSSHKEDVGDYSFQDIDSNVSVDEIADFLSYGLGFTSKANAWAGPDYWKFKKSKGSEQALHNVENQEATIKKPKIKKIVSDIDFSKSIDLEFPTIFDPPKYPKSLLLPNKRASCNIRLPEDCHYKPESLTKLFLLPEVMCFGKKSRKVQDEPGEQNDDFVSGASWDKDSVNNDQCDDGSYCSDIDDPGSLVRLPRQVNKVDIQYDKVSKQVDVQALKETLWTSIHSSVEMSDQKQEGSQVPVSLKQVVHRLRDKSPTDSQKDISPHLFFICLLHLANEHTLLLNHHPDFGDVDIVVPDSAFVKM